MRRFANCIQRLDRREFHAASADTPQNAAAAMLATRNFFMRLSLGFGQARIQSAMVTVPVVV